MATLTATTTLVTQTCFTCGVAFAMVDTFQRQRLKDGRAFYCPAGHSQIYTHHETQEQRIRQLEAENTRVRQDKMLAEQEAEAARRREARAKQETTRVKKRASAGVCVHCGRHFENVERHVKSKHPAESPSHADPRP